MDFVFMLTRADQTVPDCLDVLDDIRSVGLTHLGFKDVGVPPDVLAELARRIKQLGATSYLPFPGRPFDHPTKLGASPQQVQEDCRRYRARGCAGVDLLAYRATEADPLELVKAARRGLEGGTLLVAGSVARPEQVRAL